MITVTFRVSDQGLIEKMSIKGHAGYADSGNDIVCASASTLLYTAIASLEDLCGLGGFYTRVGIGSEVTEGLDTKEINGKTYVLVEPLTADFAILRAKKADRLGNLVYERTARNFNPVMATAAKFTIVEVDEIVEPGELDPEEIVTPFVYVDVVVPVGRGE